MAKMHDEGIGIEKKFKAHDGENSMEKKAETHDGENSIEKITEAHDVENGIEKITETYDVENGMEKKAETHDKESDIVKKVKLCVIVGFVIVILLFVKQLLGRRIDSVESLQLYMKSFGFAAPLMLTIFQALQVVVPVLPGYLGCAAGAVAFGTMTGFWCNYIGISLGSIIAYFLAKKFGKSIVLSLFPQKQYEKWSERVEKSRSYGWFLFIATLLPLFPDDFLCYFSGLMKMNSKKFIWIIILGKPWCILAYSIGFGLIR